MRVFKTTNGDEVTQISDSTYSTLKPKFLRRLRHACRFANRKAGTKANDWRTLAAQPKAARDFMRAVQADPDYRERRDNPPNP